MVERKARPPIPQSFGFDTYLSLFTYKYGSAEMRSNWSQERFWLGVRDVQIAAARVQQQAGLVTQEEVDDLVVHRDCLDVARILNLERQVGHDQVAANMHYREVAPLGGRRAGNGFTSEDTFSNVEMIQIIEGFRILRPKLVGTIRAVSGRVAEFADLACMDYTHLQAAEPTTIGYRFARYDQNLLRNLRDLDKTVPELRGKGLKGPVGTSASFVNVLEGTDMDALQHEALAMAILDLPYVTIADQTYPRPILFDTLKVLAGIGLSLHHASLEMQILQASFVDEVSEPHRPLQPGSNAMPHKKNPIINENIGALTELLPGYLFSAWMVGAFQTLARTLRDSAGKRVFLPESFLIVDEALTRAEGVFNGLKVHENSVRTNLRRFAPFSATEIILGKLVDAGADRIEAHEWLIGHSDEAKEALREGKANPIRKLVMEDERITSVIGEEAVRRSFRDVFYHVGVAPQACRKFLAEEVYPYINS